MAEYHFFKIPPKALPELNTYEFIHYLDNELAFIELGIVKIIDEDTLEITTNERRPDKKTQEKILNLIYAWFI